MSDEILFERFRDEENREALFLLFRKHQLPLYRFLSRFIGDHATAEDVVQETFLRAIRGARGYRRTTTFKDLR